MHIPAAFGGRARHCDKDWSINIGPVPTIRELAKRAFFRAWYTSPTSMLLDRGYTMFLFGQNGAQYCRVTLLIPKAGDTSLSPTASLTTPAKPKTWLWHKLAGAIGGECDLSGVGNEPEGLVPLTPRGMVYRGRSISHSLLSLLTYRHTTTRPAVCRRRSGTHRSP